MTQTVPFGKKFKETYFTNINPQYTAVNHGSYGLFPDKIFHRYVEEMKKDLYNPDNYVKVQQPETYKKALQTLGEFFHCDYRNLALVDNATTGVNTILRSFPLDKGDKIVYPSTIYGACGLTIKFMVNRYGIEAVPIELVYPLEETEILSKFEKVFKEQKPKIALFDVVISMPGVKFPYEEMTELCRKYGVLSLIDGAHCAGLNPIDLGKLRPDFFVTNLHKWLFVPRVCASLYIDKKHHRSVHTLPVSHSYLDDNSKVSAEDEENWLVDRFTFIGTKNFASIAVIGDCIRFRQEECGGEQAVYDYCHSLAIKAGDAVSKIWGGPVLQNKAKTLVSTMVTVELPLEQFGLSITDFTGNYVETIEYVFGREFQEYNTYVPVIVHNKKMYGRFSAQVYTELSDFEVAARKVVEVFNTLADDPKFRKLSGKSKL
ncbi:cysteine desulfurase Selenocysteine lyase [Scheffersomyces stipitis CBS 6054]|uniref:Cysteine desulfurase Selenocysteine lyase n=1 Tax=Scheffersomyces stipitis (strain ATCC 58785 / CBS 6054 / NBRC 10063 / NRRL Y-11545) TaxID=322104 RepID=A3LX34_PICST|nr:cysteine desulfurase Selenocysteine lyase [Scheffersomyces stipitis CBS 6054]ABN67395.2 cysteine desulfurase Selenocysteine lyase [Scheffersomyces stipitis CBS 6054]KAG2732030.1 hypothetical protein G9P44_004447 [Scheffersomyces stipitis]